MTSTVINKETAILSRCNVALKDSYKNAIDVTTEQLAAIVQPITKSTMISVLYKVDDTRSKTVNKVKTIQKISNVTLAYLNHNYTNKVKTLSGDETFVAEPLKGKYRVSSSVLAANNSDEKMIDAKVLANDIKGNNVAKIIAYFHNGNEITESEGIALGLWTNSYFEPKDKPLMGRGTVAPEDDFYIINTYFKNILFLKVEGTLYRNIDNLI
jgi:hypothetical protein